MRAKNSPERAQKMQKEQNRESHRRSQRGIAATKENKISRKDTKAQKKEGYKILAKFVGLPREYYPLCPRLGWEKRSAFREQPPIKTKDVCRRKQRILNRKAR
jgi:hypothetical protein